MSHCYSNFSVSALKIPWSDAKNGLHWLAIQIFKFYSLTSKKIRGRKSSGKHMKIILFDVTNKDEYLIDLKYEKR